jgi:uncharacterized cupin superfamily protein
MALEKILVTAKKDLPSKHINFHPAYEYDKTEVVPLDRASGNQCAVTFYDLEPGKANYPYHSHSASEEVFYIISGHGVVETNEGEIPVAAGSVVVCPPCEAGAHRIKNTSDTEKLCYIDIDTMPKADVAFYPKTGKIGVFAGGSNKFYNASAECGYYDGE